MEWLAMSILLLLLFRLALENPGSPILMRPFKAPPEKHISGSRIAGQWRRVAQAKRQSGVRMYLSENALMSESCCTNPLFIFYKSSVKQLLFPARIFLLESTDHLCLSLV